jgi:hypothetical protein
VPRRRTSCTVQAPGGNHSKRHPIRLTPLPGRPIKGRASHKNLRGLLFGRLMLSFFIGSPDSNWTFFRIFIQNVQNRVEKGDFLYGTARKKVP